MEWNIWITSTNENIITDVNSEILLSSLPVSLQEVSEPNWIKVSIKNIHQKESNVSSEENNGITINSKAVFSDLGINTVYFVFPDDLDKYKNLLKKLRGRWKLICRDGFEQLEDDKYPIEFHADNKAILCSVIDRDDTPSNPDRIIDYAFTLRRQKPLFE